jgi:hypothetical protein
MGIYAPNNFPGDRLSYTAGANIAAGQLVYFSADRTVSPTTAATGAWVGIAAYDCLSGGQVTVIRKGVHVLAASGAIAVGANVVPAAAGAVATVGSDASDGANLVGVAESAAAGGFVSVVLR